MACEVKAAGCGLVLTDELVVIGQASVGFPEALLVADGGQVPQGLVAPVVQLGHAGPRPPLQPGPTLTCHGHGHSHMSLDSHMSPDNHMSPGSHMSPDSHTCTERWRRQGQIRTGRSLDNREGGMHGQGQELHASKSSCRWIQAVANMQFYHNNRMRQRVQGKKTTRGVNCTWYASASSKKSLPITFSRLNQCMQLQDCT